jgi:ABC-type amino acid transport substrate-binding protein
VLVALGAWFYFGQAGPDDSLRRVRESGVLRVGLEATFPPFETTDGLGNFGGFDVDLAGALAAELGVTARFDNLSYDTLYDALAVGRVDVLISMIVAEPERTQDVSYSPPYYDAGLLLAVAPGSLVTGTGSLAGRRLAVEAGSLAEEEGRRLALSRAGLQIVTYSEPGLALAATARGEADACLTDPVSLAEARRGGARLEVAGARLTSEPYVVAVRRQDRSLADEVGRVVVALRERGELDRLAGKWF